MTALCVVLDGSSFGVRKPYNRLSLEKTEWEFLRSRIALPTINSKAIDVIPFADSEELARSSGATLIEVGNDHRMADQEPLETMLRACIRGTNMPAPIKVELMPYSEDWPVMAQKEAIRLLQALEGNLIEVHHIGSTAIPGIHAKPIIDLMPVVRTIRKLDDQQSVLRGLGFEFWGEYGIPGRRYCTLDDPATGRRKFQVHCFEQGSEQIARHLAFRDYLRANPLMAADYDAEKRRCRDMHPDDSHAYSDAKADWIAAQLPAALDYFARQGGAAHGVR